MLIEPKLEYADRGPSPDGAKPAKYMTAAEHAAIWREVARECAATARALGAVEGHPVGATMSLAAQESTHFASRVARAYEAAAKGEKPDAT